MAGHYEDATFSVYSNGDGTFHLLLVDANGGYIFADRMDEDDAKYAAETLNAQPNEVIYARLARQGS